MSEAEIQWLGGRSAINQSRTAVLLKCFQYLGYFPGAGREVPLPIIEYINQQLGFSSDIYESYDWSGWSTTNDRRAIRDLLVFRETREEDHEPLILWLSQQAILKKS